MGTRSNDFIPAKLAARGGVPRARRCARALSAGLAALLCALAAPAQNPQQQYLYTTTNPGAATNNVAGLAKDGETGALAAVPGSPFQERLDGTALAVDALGRFVFVLNPSHSDISMFRIDPSTGGLSEVPGSPFATDPTINPSAAPAWPNVLATEKSGQYLYVGYRGGSLPGDGAINEYSIDAAQPALVPTPQSGLDVPSSSVGMLTDPKGLYLYVALGPNTQTGAQDAQINVYAIAPLTGNLALNGAGGGSETGRCLAVDPKGRFLFYGHGYRQGFIESARLSPVDGVPMSDGPTISLGQGNFPSAMVVESGGRYLYVWAGATEIRIYSIDPATSALTEVPGSPQQLAINATVAADPMGAYIYSADGAGVHGFQVDAQRGLLTEMAGSPYAAGGAATGGIAISGTPVQAESGPGTAFVPEGVSFGDWVTGATSNTIIVRMVNTGNQTLNIAAISIAGANSDDFSQANTCGPALDPNKNCAISVTFTPSALGLRQAVLTFSDNAAGSPQAVPLGGTGVAPKPAVTLSPGTLVFVGTPAGTTSAAQAITATNSGAATLEVLGVTLSGPNPDDFAQTNDCGTVAVDASCTIHVTFTPQAQGPRTATLNLTDNAPVPQPSASLSGMGDPPFSVAPSGTSTTAATISAGQTAQFDLQVTPVTGFSGVVSLACAGAPAGASCQVSPPSVQVSGSGPAPFKVSVATTAQSVSVPAAGWPAGPSLIGARARLGGALLALGAMLMMWMAVQRRRSHFVPWRGIAWSRAAAALILLAALTSAGCGGVTATQTVQPGADPSQNITLTVTASWGQVTQTIHLLVTVH